MTLTGVPLLILTAIATAAAATGTAAGWHRHHRARLLFRPAAVLLTQALALTPGDYATYPPRPSPSTSPPAAPTTTAPTTPAPSPASPTHP
ncbi:hypothetical protein [Micromonospora siamensis]|uniref:hypothetical protein n=1 Tax=Micromonospora siamensis TaxID=299152 RepID=UPI000B5ABF9C|nr:hypothetical protein [Micromonospora siamensis]